MKILSLLSGGLDSVCWTAEFVNPENEVMGVAMNYGQKNKFELDVARTFAEDVFHIPFRIWQSQLGEMGVNQITEPAIEVTKEYDPSIILPLRNGIFLMRALAFAYAYNFDAVLIGAQTDSIKEFVHDDHTEVKFPDESPMFLNLMERAASSGTFTCQRIVRILAPVTKGWDKADLIKAGYRTIGNKIFLSFTCRNAESIHCGKCEACEGRKKAFTKAGIPDGTVYA